MATAVQILKALKKKKITKYKIAKELEVSWNTVRMWERGVFKPKEHNLKKLENL